MDLADDYDSRLTGKVTEYPRYYGDIHLIFGVYDLDLESGSSPKSYPMTFSLSYRLPAIQNTLNGNSDSSYKYNTVTGSANENPSNSQWYTHIKRWSRKWADLTSFNKNSTDYRKRIFGILNTAVRPEHFIGLRSNAKISNNEHEIREWYIFSSAVAREDNNGGNRGQLIPRKPKNQPYECLDETPVLNGLLDYYWNDIDFDLKHSLILDAGDVDRSAEYEQDRDEFTILREKDDRRFFRVGQNLANDYNTNYIKYNPADSNPNQEATYYWKADSNKCGIKFEKMPFAMLTGPGRNTTPFGPENPLSEYGGDKKERAKANQLMMLAPFGRVRKNSDNTWGHVWESGSSHSEGRRHAFAVRTCTGCHSQEGAAKSGFHIEPKYATGTNVKSNLSGYLLGTGSFSKSGTGTTYNYDIIQSRKKFLWRSHPNNTTTCFLRYKNLERPEMGDYDCSSSP